MNKKTVFWVKTGQKSPSRERARSVRAGVCELESYLPGRNPLPREVKNDAISLAGIGRLNK
jgi:hypothetical protein